MRPGLFLAAWAVSAAAGPTAYVTNQSGESLSVVDIAVGSVVSTLPVPGHPAGVALAPDGRVWVTSPEAGEVRAIDPRSGDVDIHSLGGGPLGLAVNPVSGAVYVADWYGDRLIVIEDGRISGEIATGDSPSGVAVTPDGATILTADRDSGQVSIFDAATHARVGTVNVGERPFGVTIDVSGRVAYTANVGSDDVSVIDIGARRVVASVGVGMRPYAVALANGRGFVTNSYGDSVSVFDVATRAPLATIEVGEYPEGIDASGDGTRVYVANWMSDTLSVIDTETLAVVAEIPVGSGPRAFGDFLAD